MTSSTEKTAQFRANYDTVDFGAYLPWMYGGRSYLQANEKDFRRIFLPKSIGGENESAVELSSAELIGIVKLALKNGELEIAEKHCSKAMRKQNLERISSEIMWEPYCYLAEVLEKKLVKVNIQSAQKQKLLLQVAALYNFVKNCLQTAVFESDSSVKMMKTVSRKLLNVQDNLVLLAGGNPPRCNFNPENNKKDLEELRNEVKASLESLKFDESPDDQDVSEEGHRDKFLEQAAVIRNLCERISSRMKQFLARVIEECVEVLGDPPCDYQVIVLGSLARDEMTPYSDLEWAILIGSEEENCKVFFRNLTNLVHLQIINLGETILPSMDIKALSGEWFYDDVTPKGISFDGFLPQASKTPLGNMKDFELIHCPTKMADFQSKYWYEKNPSLGEILLTVAPLASNKCKLIDEYRIKLQEILGSPCDSDNCHYNVPSTKQFSRGSCRGMTALRKDFSRYRKMLPSIDSSSEDGKLYDVKKEIYRLTDRAVAGLAACFGIWGNGAFEILDELERKKIVTPEGRNNLASAVGIALKLRLNTYLEAGKQGEQMKANSSEGGIACKSRSFYHLPSEKELFHFFFIATPFYGELSRSFLANENIADSFSPQAFFDCSDAVKGHIFCRILKYDEALQCYERALKTNPENIEMKLRQIDIQLEIDRSVEMAVAIEDELEALLRRVCKKCNLPDGIVDQRGHYVPKLDCYSHSLQTEDTYQLLDILRSIQCFHVSQGNMELARQIFDQCIELGNRTNSDELKKFMELFAYFEMPEQFGRQRSAQVTSVLNEVIEREGISTHSIVCLNELGSSLLVQGKYEQSYRSLQRALAMEHTLYGSNFNPQIKTTLTLLGVISVYLRMYEEGKLYYGQLLSLCESLSEPSDKTLIREAHLSLAYLCANTNHHEEAISYFQEVLTLLTSATYERESLFECVIHCQMATSWYALEEKDKALKSSLDAKECLRSISSTEMKVDVTYAVAETFERIERHEEAILLIREGLERIDTESEMKHKAEYLKFLGEVSMQQGLTSDAESYYEEALDILLTTKENAANIVECLLELCNIHLKKEKTSEATIKLDEALNYAWLVNEDNKMCVYIRKIGERWEKLIDVNKALNWYDNVLKELRESSALINVPLFESELHVKLGDLTEQCFSSVSISCNISFSSEQRKNAQRTHYDRASRVLHRHTVSDNVSSEIAQLYVVLASRYSSIDLAEEEKLLVEALDMSETIYGADTTCEKVAAILTGLSDIKLLTGDYVSALDFLQRSMRMEMELHLSDRYHPHISGILFRLSRLRLKDAVCEQLRMSIQRLLVFIQLTHEEERVDNTIAKENAAWRLWSAGILSLSLEDRQEANKALARKLVEQFRNDGTVIRDNTLPTSNREATVIVEYPNVLDTEDLVSTVVLMLIFLGTTESLLDEQALTGESLTFNVEGTSVKLTGITADERPQSRTHTQLSNPKTAALIHGLSPLLHLVPSDKKDLDIDSFHPFLCTTKRNGTDTTTGTQKEKQSSSVESFERKMDTLRWLAESVNCDLRKRNIEQASKTIQDCVTPFIVSLFEQNFNGHIDPAEILISEALKARERYGTMMMLVYLHLADMFPSESRRKARISKLRGECHLFERNYRIAALSLTDAAAFFSKLGTSSDFDALVEHSKILIELTRSHVLCDDVETAWMTCQEGLDLISPMESGAMKSRLETELLLLGAKLLIQRTAEQHELEKAVSFCKQGLATSMLISCSTWIDLWEFFAFNYEIQQLLATAISRLDKLDEARKVKEKLIQFTRNIAGIFEMASNGRETENDAESLKISCRLYSWIGQALLISGEESVAAVWLSKSLSAFFALGLPDTISAQEEFLVLLDKITAAKGNVDDTPFEQTIELCMQKLLEKDGDFNILLRFFEVLAQLYVDRERDEEAIMLYGRAFAVVECMENCTDVTDIRVMITFYLAQSHRRQAIKNTGKGTAEERILAEKYYQAGLQMSGSLDVLKVCYADFLCDLRRFPDAIELLEEVAAVSERLWFTQITCSYSSRIICSPVVEKYIENHGEVTTTVGILVYSALVRAFIGMGMKRKAAAACEKLSMNSEGIEIFAKRPAFMTYMLGACHKLLLSPVDDQDCLLSLHNATFSLTGRNLAKIYDELDEYSPTQESGQNVKESRGLMSGQPASSISHPPHTPQPCSSGNAMMGLEEEDEPSLTYIDFLELLQVLEGILDKPFVKQKAILAEYSSLDQYYVYEALGMQLSRRGNIDGTIECYEHCLELNEDYNYGQDLVAILAELYQVKALTTEGCDKGSYTEWMNAAQGCFDKLLQKVAKLDPFVRRAFGSFLCRQERFEEAISHFKSVLEEKDGTGITLGREDRSLVSAYLQREIDARGEVNLPLEILVYSEMVSAYLKINEVKSAHQAVLQMEKHVALFESKAHYSLILSVLGYTHKEVGNEERATEIFVSVLEMNPGHAPVTATLETCF